MKSLWKWGAAGLVLTISSVGFSGERGLPHINLHSALGNEWCMDARGDSTREGTEVWLYRCNGTDAQRWTLTSSTSGWGALVGPGGMCLDVKGRAVRDNTPLQLWQCHFGDNQRFRIDNEGRIREKQTNHVLTVKGAQERTPVYLDDNDGTPNQRWVATPAGSGRS